MNRNRIDKTQQGKCSKPRCQFLDEYAVESGADTDNNTASESSTCSSFIKKTQEPSSESDYADDIRLPKDALPRDVPLVRQRPSVLITDSSSQSSCPDSLVVSDSAPVDYESEGAFSESMRRAEEDVKAGRSNHGPASNLRSAPKKYTKVFMLRNSSSSDASN